MGFVHDGLHFLIAKRKLARRVDRIDGFAVDENLNDVNTGFSLFPDGFAQLPWTVRNLAQTTTGIDIAGCGPQVPASGKQTGA